MLKNKFELQLHRCASIALAVVVISGADLAHAQVVLTPTEQAEPAPDPDTQEKAGARGVVAKPCKKRRDGLLGAIKRTGLAGVLTDSAIGGGLGGYAAGHAASVALDEAARAEAKPSGC